MITSTERLPLACPSLRMFSVASMTSATSDRRTGEPLRQAMISGRYSSTVRAWSFE
jgi:hypothetical protein